MVRRVFFLPHRNETRGVGGIFFDYLRRRVWRDSSPSCRDAGDRFLPAYVPIVDGRKDDAVTASSEREFQEFRRGRYVEFNLVYDRGTIFGLKTGGRTESILMSLPPLVRWDYDYKPEPDSAEAEAWTYFKPQDWL